MPKIALFLKTPSRQPRGPISSTAPLRATALWLSSHTRTDSSTGARQNRISSGRVPKTDDTFSVFVQSTRHFAATELQTPVSAARILSNRTPFQNRSFKACSRQYTGETGRTARFDRQRLRFADIRRHAALTLSLVQNSAAASSKRCVLLSRFLYLTCSAR